MEKIEITPKELYEALQRLATGVNNIQMEIAFIKSQMTNAQQAIDAYRVMEQKIQSLEADVTEHQAQITTLNDKLASRDRYFVTQFISVVVFGLLVTLLTQFFIKG